MTVFAGHTATYLFIDVIVAKTESVNLENEPLTKQIIRGSSSFSSAQSGYTARSFAKGDGFYEHG